MIFILTFSTAYVSCGDYPLLCELIREVEETKREIQEFQRGSYTNPVEIETRLQRLDNRLNRLNALMIQLDSLFNNDPSLNAVKCNADCPGGSCSCWFCSCGCDDNGNPWCGDSDGISPLRSPGSNENRGPEQKAYTGYYTVYDVSGRLIFSGRLNGRLPSLRSGIYFLKDSKGNVSKVVIR